MKYYNIYQLVHVGVKKTQILPVLMQWQSIHQIEAAHILTHADAMQELVLLIS